MKLPWVSRLAYDLALDERDRLRSKNDELTEQLVRLARVGSGAPEIAPERRKRMPPMPQELVQLIETSFGDTQMQDDIKRRSQRSYAMTGSWDRAMDELLRAVGDE